MSIKERFKKAKDWCRGFYWKHRKGINFAICFTGGAVAGWTLSSIDRNLKDINLKMDELLKDGETNIDICGFDLEESKKALEEEQEKARKEYPEKFAILEEAISKLNLDEEDGEMWIIENGEPVMFKDSWYQHDEEES